MLGWLRPASHPTKKMADIVTPAELVRIVERTLQDIDPTEGDLLFAAERQRTRILERTARGVYRALFGDAPQLRMLEAIEGDLQTALDRIQAAIDTKKPLDLPQETDAAAELFSAQT